MTGLLEILKAAIVIFVVVVGSITCLPFAILFTAWAIWHTVTTEDKFQDEGI